MFSIEAEAIRLGVTSINCHRPPGGKWVVIVQDRDFRKCVASDEDMEIAFVDALKGMELPNVE